MALKNATESLKETQAKIKRQIEYNISRRHQPGNDEAMTRAIGNSDHMLKKTIGIDQAAASVAKIVESANLQVSTRGKGSDSSFDLLGDSENTQVSLKNLWEACCESEEKGQLKEANAESVYAALLRLGVTNLVAKAFGLVPVIWNKVLFVNQVSGLFGVYGSTFRPNMPKFLGAGEEFPELNVQPMGTILENVKWGSMLSFQNEAVDDDMTGELTTKASEAGEDMAILQELAFAAFLQDIGSTGLTEGDLTVTTPTYTDPDGTTGVYASTGNRQNRPSSFGRISVNTIQFAMQTLKLMKQPNGRKILVVPDSLVYHPCDWQIVQVLFGSDYWPASYYTADSTAPQGGTVSSAPNAINPIKGYGLNPMECRFLNFNTSTNGGAWFIGKAKSRSLIYQQRDGLQTLQESPSAGKSFDLDLSRWRNRMRGNWGWVLGGARFWFEGNSGA